MPYVDLHAHFLPALDDGSPDEKTTLAMLHALAAAGFAEVSATPHQKASQFLPSPELIRRAFDDTARAVRDGGVPLVLHLAAESFWDHVFFERCRDGSLPRYDGGKAFLFELPPGEAPPRFDDWLFAQRVRGLLPVLAHPERYRALLSPPDRLVGVASSCALVVDLGAVAGSHGFAAARAARRLLAERVAHAAASDVHSLADVPDVVRGIAWIRKKLGPDAEKRLLEDNPRRILAGELPDP